MTLRGRRDVEIQEATSLTHRAGFVDRGGGQVGVVSIFIEQTLKGTAAHADCGCDADVARVRVVSPSSGNCCEPLHLPQLPTQGPARPWPDDR